MDASYRQRMGRARKGKGHRMPVEVVWVRDKLRKFLNLACSWDKMMNVAGWRLSEMLLTVPQFVVCVRDLARSWDNVMNIVGWRRRENVTHRLAAPESM